MYAFYNLPYCAPTDIEVKREDLGPLLKGDRPTKTLYDIKFRGEWRVRDRGDAGGQPTRSGHRMRLPLPRSQRPTAPC